MSREDEILEAMRADMELPELDEADFVEETAPEIEPEMFDDGDMEHEWKEGPSEPLAENQSEEPVPEENRGYYEDLLAQDWELVLAELEQERLKKEKADKAKKARTAREKANRNANAGHAYEAEEAMLAEHRRQEAARQAERQAREAEQAAARQETGSYNSVALNETAASTTPDYAANQGSSQGAYGAEYETYTQNEQQRRNREVMERRQAEERAREEAHREEQKKNLEEMRQRERENLGVRSKSGHLDYRHGADNMERADYNRADEGNRYITENPPQESSEAGRSGVSTSNPYREESAQPRAASTSERLYTDGPDYTRGYSDAPSGTGYRGNDAGLAKNPDNSGEGSYYTDAHRPKWTEEPRHAETHTYDTPRQEYSPGSPYEVWHAAEQRRQEQIHREETRLRMDESRPLPREEYGGYKPPLPREEHNGYSQTVPAYKTVSTKPSVSTQPGFSQSGNFAENQSQYNGIKPQPNRQTEMPRESSRESLPASGPTVFNYGIGGKVQSAATLEWRRDTRSQEPLDRLGINEAPRNREEGMVAAGVACSEYTLNGVRARPDAHGIMGEAARDKSPVTMSAVQKSLSGNLDTGNGAFEITRNITRMPDIGTHSTERASRLTLKVFPNEVNNEGHGISLETAKAYSEAAKAHWEETKRGNSGVSFEPATITENDGLKNQQGGREKFEQKIKEKTGVDIKTPDNSKKDNRRKGERRSDAAYQSIRFKQSAARIVGSSIGKTAKLSVGIVLATVEEGLRDGGGDKAVSFAHGVQTITVAAFYSIRYRNGDKMIRESTGFKNEKALDKFDKAQIGKLKDLRKEYNQLLTKLHKELGVSGDITPFVNSPAKIDELLKRTDLTQEARNTLNKLRVNELLMENTGKWLDLNANDINRIVDPEKLKQLRVSGVEGLNLKGLKKLFKNIGKDTTAQLKLLNGMLPKDILAQLGGGKLEGFMAAVNDGTLQHLLNSKAITGEAAEIVQRASQNVDVLNKITDRSGVLKGKTGNRKRKMAKKMVKRFIVGKITKALLQNDEAGMQVIGSILQTTRNVKDAIWLTKTTGKAVIKVGKAVAKTPQAIMNGGKAVYNVGRSIVNGQVDELVRSTFRPKGKLAKKGAGRLVNPIDGLKEKVAAAKNTVQAVKAAGTKAVQAIKGAAQAVKTAAQAAVRGIQAAAHAVAAAVSSIVPLILTPIGLIVLLVIIVVLLVVVIILNVFCTEDKKDVQKIVDEINEVREEIVIDEIYESFKDEKDPLGHPYGYTTLDGATSDNLLTGVTWEYADGVSNNTAEIISLAAVYFQQNWPSSNDIANFFKSDDRAFFKFCKDLAGYGLNVTAQESHPYSCLQKGGCVLGYRSEGEQIEIKTYEEKYHSCMEGNPECGDYSVDVEHPEWEPVWHWGEHHGEGESSSYLAESGTRTVTVYFPVIFPDGARDSELSRVPDGNTITAEGVYRSEELSDVLVFDSSANLYKGVQDDWFIKPGELSTSFTVIDSAGEDEITNTYTVSFNNSTAIPWCSGELNNNWDGHYDLNCVVYLVGYNEYEEPCLKPNAPENADVPEDEDGIKGGTGTLEPLARKINNTLDEEDNVVPASLTRTVRKLNQHGDTYSGGTGAKYTKTTTLPSPEDGFTRWFDDDWKDASGYVCWAKMLYANDWEELYDVTAGIKCRSFGRRITDAEFEAIIAGLDLSSVSEERKAVVAIAIKSQGQFSYVLGSKPGGGPGRVQSKSAYDCSGFIRYCYWMAGYSFDAVNTADYPGASDLREISASALQPGDLQVMLSSENGGTMGHVRMFVGIQDGKAMWAECVGNRGSYVNTWSNSDAGMWGTLHYYSYTGF